MTSIDPSDLVIVIITCLIAIIGSLSLIGIRRIISQMKEMNGSIRNTRETYVPQIDCNRNVDGVREDIKGIHKRMDIYFKPAV